MTHPDATLTLEQARQIKKRLADGDPKGAIARDYGVSVIAVRRIAKGLTWRKA